MRIDKSRRLSRAKMQKARRARRRTNARFARCVKLHKRCNSPKNGASKPPRPRPIPPITTAYQPVDDEDTESVD